jgi:galactokinase
MQAFATHYGYEPVGVWSAPGRVNLIGEHTDYNGGLVLPFAIDRRTWCAVGDRDDRVVRVSSTLTHETVQVSLDGLDPDQLSGWSAYVLGVIWALTAEGIDLTSRSGLDILLTSDVPLGAGLSSSAAIECATAIAINDLWHLDLPLQDLARICQRAENRAVGAPTGIMDQTASLLGKADHGVLLDCESFATELVPLRFADEGITVMVIDTHVSHAHATGGYADRRASCEKAAAALGVTSLRALTRADLERAEQALDDETFRRVRHIVTENDRVAHTAAALLDSGPRSIGALLVASHVSMRDDFEISVPELDLAVDTAIAGGAIGARMTGGGFGGAAIALVPAGHYDIIERAVLAAFAATGSTTPTIFSVTPSPGARRERALTVPSMTEH